MNINPVLAEITRGGIVESFHRASYAVLDRNGMILATKGDIARPVFPRSAIKAFQALPLIDSGAAEAFGFSKRQVALACASHSGEARHIEAVRSMLQKAGIDEKYLECGSHWPIFEDAARDMAADGEKPDRVHNNCSGKHAGMLATAKYLGEPLADYIDKTHPVQKRIEAVISQFCQCDLTAVPCGIDGCSVPTWAVPLEKLALGFAKLAKPADKLERWGIAAGKIIEAAKAAPFMVAGTDRFCTNIMKSVPRLFAKTGAEGVYCGAIPHAGIGIAVKCDDGAARAAEVIFAKALASLPVWNAEEQTRLAAFSQFELKNRNATVIGKLRAC